jgi:hypothetical protein
MQEEVLAVLNIHPPVVLFCEATGVAVNTNASKATAAGLLHVTNYLAGYISINESL